MVTQNNWGYSAVSVQNGLEKSVAGSWLLLFILLDKLFLISSLKDKNAMINLSASRPRLMSKLMRVCEKKSEFLKVNVHLYPHM